MKSLVSGLFVVTFLSTLVLPERARAGESWVCSITEAVECADGEPCGEPDMGGLPPPTFLRVDADAKKITLLAPASRRGEVTRIGTVKRIDELWLFTGVENGRAWSMVLSSDGYLTLSVTYDGVTWAAFGHCMPEE